MISQKTLMLIQLKNNHRRPRSEQPSQPTTTALGNAAFTSISRPRRLHLTTTGPRRPIPRLYRRGGARCVRSGMHALIKRCREVTPRRKVASPPPPHPPRRLLLRGEEEANRSSAVIFPGIIPGMTSKSYGRELCHAGGGGCRRSGTT